MRMVRRADHRQGRVAFRSGVTLLPAAGLEQSRAAASGRSAVQIVERRVEVEIPAAPRRQDWPRLLGDLAVNSRTAGSTTATCSSWPAPSAPSTRRSVAESTPTGADPHGRHRPTDGGDLPGDGGDTARCGRHPAEPPRKATGHRREPGDELKLFGRGCHQTAEIGAFSHGRSAPAVGVRMVTRSEEKR